MQINKIENTKAQVQNVKIQTRERHYTIIFWKYKNLGFRILLDPRHQVEL